MTKPKGSKAVVVAEQIEQAIHDVRGHRIVLDTDLAKFYGVETRSLVRAVMRNLERFPADFMFLLSNQELADLRSQPGISSRTGHGGRRTLPYAFTEHGAVMVASVLNSPTAVEMSIHVVRAFIHLREALEHHRELSRELRDLRRAVSVKFDAHDQKLKFLLEAIDRILNPGSPKKRRIGF
jgi:hypothetical protein